MKTWTDKGKAVHDQPGEGPKVFTRRSSILVVELHEQDGKLSCNRDEPTLIDLQPPDRTNTIETAN